VSRYQRGKTNLDFTEARDSEWQWHQLGHMQVCTSLHIDNHASTPPLSFLQAGCPSCRPTNSVEALSSEILSTGRFEGGADGVARRVHDSSAAQDAVLHGQPHPAVRAHLDADDGRLLPADDRRRKDHDVGVDISRADRLPAGARHQPPAAQLAQPSALRAVNQPTPEIVRNRGAIEVVQSI